MAVTARDVMTSEAEGIGVHDSIVAAAQRMAELSLWALPIRGEDGRAVGVLTEREILVSVVAAGLDTAVATAGRFARDEPVTIGVDDSVDDLVRTMAEHRVTALPVVDGDRLVGIVTAADVDAQTPRHTVVDLVTRVSVGR